MATDITRGADRWLRKMHHIAIEVTVIASAKAEILRIA
jgi:hypothetical protein